jgi:hypothetical protein
MITVPCVWRISTLRGLPCILRNAGICYTRCAIHRCYKKGILYLLYTYIIITHSILQYFYLSRLYQCPQCQKSIADMSVAWRRHDEEREMWQMPRHLREFKVKVANIHRTQFHSVERVVSHVHTGLRSKE